MPGMFYKLGKLTGPAMRKGQWIWKSVTGDEVEVLDAEHQVGKDLAVAMRAQLGLGDSQFPEHEAWIKDMGEALASRVMNKDRKFSFQMFEADEPNAFALPGGFIFVARSLLDLCNWDRDETAFILGHEMGHVVKGHSMDRMMNGAAISAATRVIPGAGVLSGWLKSVGARYFQTAYSRDHEFEADKFGARLTAAAGLDPNGALRLLERLDRLSGENFPLGQYFSTHPATADRVKRLDQLIKK
jgi:Zn-dependent protease with chaperone function